MIEAMIDPKQLKEFALDMKKINPKVLFKGEWEPFVNFSKNLALAAAVLMFLAIPTPWAYSLIP